MRNLFILMLSIVSISLLAGAALAQIPDATQSTVDECFVTCPAGDIPFTVVVRDVDGNAVPGADVVVDFCGCPGQQLCLTAGQLPCNDGTLDRVSLPADASGVVVFNIAAGGACQGFPVEISANGVFLAQREVRAMDYDNNFVVEVADFVVASGNDYNCDGLVNLLDQALFANHGTPMHACEGPVSSHQQSWGTMKSLFR